MTRENINDRLNPSPEEENEYRDGKADRQFKIMQLRLAGLTNQTRIGAILGVSQRTVSRDMADIDALTKQAATQDLAVAKGNEILRIERMIAALWRQCLAGDIPSINMVLKLIERKAKFLGLDAPVTINLVEAEARRLAREFGFDSGEILKEAERILGETQVLAAAGSGE